MSATLLDVAVTIALGVGSSLVYDVIKIWLPRWDPMPLPEHRLRRIVSNLPLTLLPIATLLVTRYRWVVEPRERAVLLIGSLVLGCLLQFTCSYVWRRRARLAPTVAVLVSTVVPIAAFMLDDALPHYVALRCPPSRVAPPVALEGRALAPDVYVTMYYERADTGGRLSDPVYVQGNDGSYRTEMPSSARPGETWSFWGETARGRTRTCRVALR